MTCDVKIARNVWLSGVDVGAQEIDGDEAVFHDFNDISKVHLPSHIPHSLLLLHLPPPAFASHTRFVALQDDETVQQQEGDNAAAGGLASDAKSKSPAK